MKTKYLIAAALLVPFAAFAQDTNAINIVTNVVPNQSDAAASESSTKLVNDLIMIAIAVVAPMLVRLGKWALPFVKDWFLPVLAPLLTLAANAISDLAGGPSISPLLAALLGAAGVGVREIKDQVGWRMTAPKSEVNSPSIKSSLMLFLLCGAMLAGGTGCAWLNPEGVKPVPVAEGQDSIIVNAERIQETSLFAYERMINWELQNRAILPAEISRAVDKARAEFLYNWTASRAALADYKVHRDPNAGHLERLVTALSVAQASFLQIKGTNAQAASVIDALSQLAQAVEALKK